MLGLRGQTRTAWAVFDPAQYASAREAAGLSAPPGDAEAARRHYLDHGQRDGQSPNAWIDEAWLRAAHPAIAAAIRAGHAESGFDAFCRADHPDISPHWLFDPHLYCARYPDLTEDALRDAGFADAYDHYVREGDREGRSGSLFLDPGYVLSRLPPPAAARAAALGCFAWYLSVLGTVAEPRTTPWFDPDWFLARYPDAAAALARGAVRGALHYYLATPGERDPLPWFSESFYRARYPDIAAAVASSTWRSGYLHFLHHGAFERRSPGPNLDLGWYADSDPAIAREIETGRAREAFSHFLLFGMPEGRPGVPPPAPDAPAPGNAARPDPAASLLPGIARAKLDFTCAGPPALSAVLVLRDRFAATLRALAALRAGFAGPIELILVDAGSTDETRQIARYVAGAVRLPFEQALGWLRGANAGLACAGAPAVLFLDPGVALVSGAVAAALARFDADPAIGAVGGRLLAPDGTLIEAGAILWRDGSLTRYREGAPALAPEANFRRRSDACAPALLFARREALTEAGGFDTAFADPPAPEAAVADLALRLAGSGLALIHDPAVTGEYLDPPAPIAPDGAALLAARHAETLRFRALPDPGRPDSGHPNSGHPNSGHEVFARAPGPPPRRVLFIDDTIPVRRAGSGFVRSAELIGAMAELGWEVGVLGLAPCRFDRAVQFADLPETAEILHDRTEGDLPALLAERAGYYDAIWVARTHNLVRLRPVLARALADAPRPPAIVLDSEAIAALREAEHARLRGEAAPDPDAALAAEFADARICTHTVAVSEAEAALLRRLDLPSVHVIGHIRAVVPTPRPFAARAGLLFLGAMHEPECPNLDALDWFVTAVLPLVEKSLRWETRLTVAGYTAPGVSLDRFAHHPRISLRGAVAETEPLFDQHRVFVAPTRYAAGLPYKLHEAASFGLPIVASGLLARQLGWDDAMLSAEADDPAGFADAVVRLYRDEALWTRLRNAAAARVAAEASRAQTLETLRAILG